MPVAGSAVTLSSSLDITVGADAIVVELLSAPSASSLSTGYVVSSSLLDSDSVLNIAAAGNATASFTPDLPGEYSVRIYLVHRLPGASVLGADGAQRWRVKTTDTGTIDVGGYADLPILTARGVGATLRLTIVGNSVTGAAFRDFTSSPARVAALQSSVTDALTAIEGTTVATALGVFQTRVADLLAEVADHTGGTTWHTSADTKNAITLAAPTTQDAAITVLNHVREKFSEHVVHIVDVHSNADAAAIPIVREAATLAEATVLLADLRERCFERHRVRGTASTPPIHINAGGDTTNALTSPTKLDDIIVSFLDALVEADPSVASGESEGLYDAAHMAGFTIVS